MSLADIIAKKKADALAAAKGVDASISEAPAPSISPDPLPVVEDSPISMVVPPDIVNTEVAVTQVPKKKTFQELMAEKNGKSLASPSTPAPAPAATIASIPVKVDTTTVKVQPVSLPNSSTPASESATSAELAAEQAYADIQPRIEALMAMSETELDNAMKELKKSLLANPAAVSLMEDTDYGKMVIALRRLTGEAASEAGKEKAAGKKKASKVNLDPDAIALAFEEI